MMTDIGRRIDHRGGLRALWWGLASAAVMWVVSLAPVVAADGEKAADAGLCFDSAQSRGWHVRVLQTQLMVAALSCRGRRADGHVALYNDIIRTRRQELKRAADHFRRAAARMGGAGAVDRLVTAIANRVTRRALEEPEFCARAAALARAIQAVPDTPLVQFTSLMPIRLPLPSASCPAAPGRLVADE